MNVQVSKKTTPWRLHIIFMTARIKDTIHKAAISSKGIPNKEAITIKWVTTIIKVGEIIPTKDGRTIINKEVGTMEETKNGTTTIHKTEIKEEDEAQEVVKDEVPQPRSEVSKEENVLEEVAQPIPFPTLARKTKKHVELDSKMVEMFKKVELPPLKQSAARFVLADKSIITVTGIAEDVLIDGRVVSFSLDEATRHPLENHSKFRCDLIDNVVAKVHYSNLDEKSMIEGTSVGSPHECEENTIPPPDPPEVQMPSQEQHVELKPLPPHLKYAYLDKAHKFPVIVARGLTPQQEEKLLNVLRRNKRAIGWSLVDLVGISSQVCEHRIFLEEGARAVWQPQRCLNPTILEVVKKEVTRLLEADIIYLISDSEWVSPVQVIPKKSGVTTIKNESGELIATRVQNSWRIWLFGVFSIHIALEDQEKTTFTCPFGTYAYKRMPFGLCNAPVTFQRCMMSIFADLQEHWMEVFMDDFSVYGDSFDLCLDNLAKVLERCTKTNIVLNFEKCHFMVRQGIVLGHIISNDGISMDPAKINVISSLPYPSSEREVRAFLGHTGFYW
nr:uncharacterized protein LOC112778504 [Arachis hypogaea]